MDALIKNRDIIVMGIQAWDIEIGSNCKNIALQMSKHNRVLYVNPPIDRVTLFKERGTEKVKRRQAIRKGDVPALQEIGDQFWNLYPKRLVEPANWVGSGLLFDKLNYQNAKRFFRDIQDAIEELDFTDIIVFNDSSMFLGQYVQEFLNPSHYVYYMRDYLIKVPYWQRHGERLEPVLLKNADTVVNNSLLYTDYGAQYNSNSYMVGQGCDVSLFNDEKDNIECASELRHIPGPIIGYVGYLTSMRLDIDLLVHLAKERPKWSLVLVGPEDDDFKNSALHGLDNVFFLGSKDGKELPNYIKGFDVAINPQLINDWTRGNYPRKIDEYLAMGKATVATGTRAMDMFADHVYLPITKEEYLNAIERALDEDSIELKKKRIAFAKQHTWENNVNDIYEAILNSVA